MPTHTLAEMLRAPLGELVLQVNKPDCARERTGVGGERCLNVRVENE